MTTTSRQHPSDRAMGWLLLVGGIVGALASFVLTVEKIHVLEDPSYVPSCSINPVLSCGSIMGTDQAAVFGFANPLLGLMGFPVVAATGALVLSAVALPRWYWRALQVGVTLGMAFVVWLVGESLYVLGALCPYCMVVWAVFIPLFWYLTVRNATAGVWGQGVAESGVTRFAATWSAPIVTLMYGVVIALALLRFWSYWSTLI